ncbi:glycosyltransferase family 2 protein [Gordonia sp. VNQ95]|uniref:glycosyltransferase family 2 protein n=1 Tax=Gordonia sp. VNQ95 TaxID=3156619 RepID=UPI0032B59A4D
MILSDSRGVLVRAIDAVNDALIVIVTYNSEPNLPTILETIEGWVSVEHRRCAVVLDNSSSMVIRSGIERLSSADHHLGTVMYIANPNNEGFSYGVNIAVNRAESCWSRFGRIVLINPDVSAEPGVVLELARRVQASNDIGVAGAFLRTGEGRQDNGCARRKWNRRRLFADVSGARALVRVLGTDSRNIEAEVEETDVDIVSGALMCIRRDIFAEGLDTRLPMYLEDQEICLRSKRAGRRVVSFSDISAIHGGGESRVSARDRARPLRCLELAEAPTMIMRDWDGYSVVSIKAVIATAALVRASLAVPLFGVMVAQSRRLRDPLAYLAYNLHLTVWLVRWSIFADPMREERLTLSEYFDVDARMGLNRG